MTTKKIPVLSQLDTRITGLSSELASNTTQSTCSSSGMKPCPMYIAINEYTKRMEDELDMKPGDKIQVITTDEEYNDGWFYGRNLRTKEEGLYPMVFTQEISIEQRPSAMRSKSTKRIASSGNGSTSNFSGYSQNGSTSELPTPQPLETAAPMPLSKKKPVDRKISLKTTMSDIDKALEELRSNSMEQLDNGGQNMTHETIFSSTRDLDISYSSGNPEGSSSAKSLSNERSAGANSINGIDTSELNPAMAESWTPPQVTAYFIMSGFDVQSSSRFQQHKVSGAILLQLELAHLKELEIDSFGTRFEIHKEIEDLRKASKRADKGRIDGKSAEENQLMPPAFLNQGPTYRGHVRKVSRSLEDFSSNSTPMSAGSNERPKSKANQLQASQNDTQKAALALPSISDKELDDERLFVSPRRAPKPPSYPSPVQPPKSPVIGNDSGNRYSPPTIYEKAMSSSLEPPGAFKFPPNSPQEFKAKSGFSFGGKSSTSSSTPTTDSYPSGSKAQASGNNAGNRNSVIYSGHKKALSGGSFVDLYNRVSMLSPTAPNLTEEGSSQDEDLIPNGRPSSSVYAGHSRNASVARSKLPSQDIKKHRRASSLVSFFSAKNEERPVSPAKNASHLSSHSHSKRDSFIMSPFRQQFTESASHSATPAKVGKSHSNKNTPTPPTLRSPIKPNSAKKDDSKRRSVSAKESSYDSTKTDDDKNKRSVSEAQKGKGLRTINTKNISRKQQTSAFMEGIRNVSVKDAMMDADCSGWMSKKGSGTMGVWRTRFFTLHGTRLSYFASTTDTRERGLIDITAHCVVPAKEDDKLVSLYAASTGKGRYCFKLLPPQPGSKKGLTFTQPRVHYFAVDSKDDMRAWMAALIKTTIDIDTSVPVISSCATPTVSLSRAQEMLSQAREATRLREQQRYLNEEDEDQMLWEKQQNKLQSSDYGTGSHGNTLRQSDDEALGSAINLSSNGNTTVNSNGFASPYLLASGVLSPSLGSSSGKFQDTTPDLTANLKGDYFGRHQHSSGEHF